MCGGPASRRKSARSRNSSAPLPTSDLIEIAEKAERQAARERERKKQKREDSCCKICCEEACSGHADGSPSWAELHARIAQANSALKSGRGRGRFLDLDAWTELRRVHVGFCEPGLLRSSELRFMARPWYPLFLLHGEPLRGALMDLMEDDEVTAYTWVLELIFPVSLPEKVELIKNIIILQYPKPPACEYFDNPAGLGIARRMDQRTGKYVNSSIDLLMRAWPEYNGVSLSLFAAKTVILDCVCMQLKYDTPIEKLLKAVKRDYPAVFNQVGRRGDPFLVLTWRSYFFLLSQLFDVNAAIARDLLEFVETERKNSTVVVDKMAVVSFGSMAYNFPKYGFGDDDHGFSRKNKNVQLLPHGQKPLHMCSFIDVTHTGGKRDRFASGPL